MIRSAIFKTTGIVRTESNEDIPTSCAENSGFELYISARIETMVALGREHTVVINKIISESAPKSFITRHIIRGVIISFIALR